MNLISEMLKKILDIVKRYRLNRHIKRIACYSEIGNSYFLESFDLRLQFPLKNRTYLIVGDNSTVAAKITCESSNGKILIGNNSFVGNCNIISAECIEIQDYVFIAWGCYLYDHDSHSLDYRNRELDISQQLSDYRNKMNFLSHKNWSVVKKQKITVCSNAWIGFNSIILKGVTIGEGAVVGAGSVVTRDVAPWTVVAGNPARVVKILPESHIKQ